MHLVPAAPSMITRRDTNSPPGEDRRQDRSAPAQGRAQAESALTLIELVLVVGVVVTLAALVWPRLSDTQDEAADGVTRASLSTIREAIVGTEERPGFHDDLRELPLTVRGLFLQPAALPSGAPVPSFDPVTEIGWNGPYLLGKGDGYVVDAARGFTLAYGADGDPTVLDGWRHPIVLQWPDLPELPLEQRSANVRLVSAGPDGVIDTPGTELTPDPKSSAQVGDDIVLYVLR